MNTSCLPAGRLSVYAILPSEVSAESGKFNTPEMIAEGVGIGDWGLGNGDWGLGVGEAGFVD